MNSQDIRQWAYQKLNEIAQKIRTQDPNKIPLDQKRDMEALNSILYRVKEKPGKGKEWLKPRFIHDCKECQFLGNLGGFDYYFHIHGPNTAEIIIRCSDKAGFIRTYNASNLANGLELDK